MSIDGENNSVKETWIIPEPVNAKNPDGIAFKAKERVLKVEGEECYTNVTHTQPSLIVYNPNVFNSWGDNVAYRVVLPRSDLLLADPSSFIFKRAGFATRPYWVTRSHPDEKYASGKYPNQHAGGDGVPKYVKQQRSIENKPIVLWLTYSTTHLPTPEQWPVMNVEKVGYKLMPHGFFNRNPALGVPPQHNALSVKQDEEPALRAKL